MPRSPSIRRCLAGFRDTFQEARSLARRPAERHDGSTPHRQSSPELEDVVIDDIPPLSPAKRTSLGIDAEQRFAAAMRVALKNKHRGDPGKAGVQETDDAGLEQTGPHAIRRLLRIRLAYEIEQRRFVLVIRRRDQAQERLLASSEQKESLKHRAELITELIGAQGQILANQDRLVSLWTEHQTVRLALFRDLGTLPWTTGSRSTTSSPPGPAVTG